MNSIKKKLSELNEWDLYNGFFLMNDIERLRKFLVREYLFKLSLDIPGDIVEVGVFKGTGMAQLLKLREIFIPACNKKVIGFDLFSTSNDYKNSLTNDDNKLSEYYNRCDVKMENGIQKEEIQFFFDNIKLTNRRVGFNEDIYQLIEGDVTMSIPKYLDDNPGFRISFLYIDLDIENPTYTSLSLLYDKIVPGGIIVLDDYACEKWTASNGIDKFLKEHPDLKVKTLEWGRSPAAYMIKN